MKTNILRNDLIASFVHLGSLSHNEFIHSQAVLVLSQALTVSLSNLNCEINNISLIKGISGNSIFDFIKYSKYYILMVTA